MKAQVDADLCVGCELCANTCPEVFVMEDGKAVVKTGSVPGDAEDSCRESQENCPVEAISLEE
ncbi:MAG: ferredoxin [Candidatus Omnitrophota bacterium]